MKLTTLQYSFEPGQFRKLAFKDLLRGYVPFCLQFLIVSLICQGVAFWGGLLVSGFVATLLFVGLPFVITYWVTNDQFLKKIQKGFFKTMQILEFDDNGVYSNSDSGSHSFVVWSDIESAVVSKGYSRIHLSHNNAFLIPDSAWPSSLERDQFLALLRSKGLLK